MARNSNGTTLCDINRTAKMLALLDRRPTRARHIRINRSVKESLALVESMCNRNRIAEGDNLRTPHAKARHTELPVASTSLLFTRASIGEFTREATCPLGRTPRVRTSVNMISKETFKNIRIVIAQVFRNDAHLDLWIDGQEILSEPPVAYVCSIHTPFSGRICARALTHSYPMFWRKCG